MAITLTRKTPVIGKMDVLSQFHNALELPMPSQLQWKREVIVIEAHCQCSGCRHYQCSWEEGISMAFSLPSRLENPRLASGLTSFLASRGWMFNICQHLQAQILRNRPWPARGRSGNPQGWVGLKDSKGEEDVRMVSRFMSWPLPPFPRD